jgi:hypothetical protein
MQLIRLFEGMPRWTPQLDYTATVDIGGRTRTYRNPGKDNRDKNETCPDGSKVVLFGTSQWDWQAGLQHGVGIDIDTGNHGLTSEQFAAALAACERVPWLEVVHSKSGNGIHAYATFTTPVPVTSRSEQTALGNAVCVAASRVAGFPLQDAKCCAGGNMWTYAREAAPTGFSLLKPATQSLDPATLPPGWRDATEAGSRKVAFAPSDVEIDPGHLAIEKQIAELGPIIWQEKHRCWHIQTRVLEAAHLKHGYRGLFATNSSGSTPINGYMFPLPNSGFLVKRFGNVTEHDSWFGDYAYLNVEADSQKALAHFCGSRSSKGFVFSLSQLHMWAKAIGVTIGVTIACDLDRTFYVNSKKDLLIVRVERRDTDESLKGWSNMGKLWECVFPCPAPSAAQVESVLQRANCYVRALATPAESKLWIHRRDNDAWVKTSSIDANNVLKSVGYQDPSTVLGQLRRRPYDLVFEPFKPEYLPQRRWNPGAPQFACTPAAVAGDTPTWDAIWNHLGATLDDGIDDECRRVGITSGSQYLQLWFKIILETPAQRLPYLFFFSKENGTGKSSLGVDAATCLIANGVGEITPESLTGTFTSELEGKVLCLIEEVNLNRGTAYQKIKTLISSPTVNIRRMRTDPYPITNYTHYIHTAQDPTFVPVENDDMRLVIGEVPILANKIPKAEFLAGLKAEAPSMLRKLLDMQLSEASDRFWLPVLNTPAKEMVLAGQYDEGLSPSENSVKDYSAACLEKGGFVPCEDAWSAYMNYVGEWNYHHPDDKKSAIHRNGFLPTMKQKLHHAIDRKKRKVGNCNVWCYEGVQLKSDALRVCGIAG